MDYRKREIGGRRVVRGDCPIRSKQRYEHQPPREPAEQLQVALKRRLDFLEREIERLHQSAKPVDEPSFSNEADPENLLPTLLMARPIGLN